LIDKAVKQCFGLAAKTIMLQRWSTDRLSVKFYCTGQRLNTKATGWAGMERNWYGNAAQREWMAMDIKGVGIEFVGIGLTSHPMQTSTLNVPSTVVNYLRCITHVKT